MKRIITQLQLGLVAGVALFASSCKTEKLGEVLAKETYPAVSLSLDNKLEIKQGSVFTVSGSDVTVPITLNFSAPTSRAFTVNLTADVDTVAKLITAGTLPATTVAFPSGAVGVVQTANVPVGVTKFTFNAIINRSAVEKNYGKDMAVVVKVTNPAKGNTIVAGKGSLIMVVKSTDILKADEIHDIAFVNADVAIPTVGMYEVGSENITINVPITLSGSAGPEFTLTATVSPDSVTKRINNGTLTKSVLYAGNKISFTTPSIKFQAGSKTAMLSFTTKINALLAVQPAAGVETVDMPVIAFTLSNPTQFQLGAKRTVYVKMNPNFFRPYNGYIPFVIKKDIGVESPTIWASNYDFGGQGVAYNDDNSKSGDGGFRAPDNVDVSGDASPRTVVGWTSNNEWLTYTVDIEEAGTYDMTLFLGSDNDRGRINVFLDNVKLNTDEIKGLNTGSYGNQKPQTVSGIKLPKGRHILKAFWVVGSHDFRGFVFKRTS